jgi:Resolvase, N terminal domain
VVEKTSGARADRPELTRLLRDMLRKGDTLVIWKLDRLGRSLKAAHRNRAEDLKGRGDRPRLSNGCYRHLVTRGGCSSFTCSAQSPNSNVNALDLASRVTTLPTASATIKGFK